MNLYIDWICDEIKHVCLTYKKRVAGSESERACSDYMAHHLSQWSDVIEKESYSVHPKAFTGTWSLSALCGIISVVCFIISVGFSLKWLTAISVQFTLIAFILWLLQHALYRQCIDFLYPKSNSQNVMAVRKSIRETRQRIIICGHADAAYEMPLLQKFSATTIAVMSLSAVIAPVICISIGLLTLFTNPPQQILITFCLFYGLNTVPLVFFLFFVNWKTVVDGANDNLTGCFLGMSIMKEMEDQNQRYEYTDVCCLITGGEESGLRGALAYAKAHKQELLNTSSIVIAVDTIHEMSQLKVYTRGIYHTQKNSGAVCDLLRAAGVKCGVTLPDAGFYPGATDAEAFSRYGIEAAALCAVNHKPAPYYHTVADTWDNLDKDCISLTRDILKSCICLFDMRAVVQRE